MLVLRTIVRVAHHQLPSTGDKVQLFVLYSLVVINYTQNVQSRDIYFSGQELFSHKQPQLML